MMNIPRSILNKLLFIMTIFFLVSTKSSILAQDYDDDDDNSEPEEMDEDLWQTHMDEYTNKRADLMNQLQKLNTETDKLKFDFQTRTDEAENAVNSIWAAVGSVSQYNEYKIKFADAERIVENGGLINQEMWDYLTNSGINARMKCLPEFWDRYNRLRNITNDDQARFCCTDHNGQHCGSASEITNEERFKDCTNFYSVP